jgi:hypothetical protein
MRKSTPDGGAAAPKLPFQLHFAGFWARALVFLKSALCDRGPSHTDFADSSAGLLSRVQFCTLPLQGGQSPG